MITWTVTAAPISDVLPTDHSTTPGQVLAAGSADHLELAATEACAAVLGHFDTHATHNPGGAPVAVTVERVEVLTGPAYEADGDYHHDATATGLEHLHHTLTGPAVPVAV